MSEPRRIYLDNAATSWPKPPSVYDAVDRAMRELGAPAGRGTYREAQQVERGVADARRRIAELIHAPDPRRVIFTLNGTDSLNLALHGLLKPGDHVVTSVAEHNSVLRPLRFLAQNRGVTSTYVECDGAGIVDPEEFSQAITPDTRLLALIHASNVTGAIQPVAEVGQIAAEHGLLFLIDAAQSIGHIEIDVERLGAHLLAAPGHKGLLGPLGTGLLYIAPGVESELSPFRQGGTGTQSESDLQPNSLPDKYEAGNHNVPGILGLGAGAAFIQQTGLESIRSHQQTLTRRLIDGLHEIHGVELFGPSDPLRQVGVVSFRIAQADSHDVASTLDAAFSVQARAGLHCAPRMHKTLGTATTGGTIRFSVGPMNLVDDMNMALEAVETIANSM